MHAINVPWYVSRAKTMQSPTSTRSSVEMRTGARVQFWKTMRTPCGTRSVNYRMTSSVAALPRRGSIVVHNLNPDDGNSSIWGRELPIFRKAIPNCSYGTDARLVLKYRTHVHCNFDDRKFAIVCDEHDNDNEKKLIKWKTQLLSWTSNTQRCIYEFLQRCVLQTIWRRPYHPVIIKLLNWSVDSELRICTWRQKFSTRLHGSCICIQFWRVILWRVDQSRRNSSNSRS